MRRRARRRTPVLALVLLTLLLTTATPGRAAGRVETDAEGLMLSLVNDRRTSHGLDPLAMANDLRDDAREHASRQLSSGSVHHDPDGASDICCYRSWGENVAGWSGEGPLEPADVRRITRHLNDSLFDSDGHREHLLDDAFTEVGIGIVADRDSGDLYVTQVFREPADPSTYDGHFADDEDSPHQPGIEAIADAGITDGCNPPTNNRFCPNLEVTRSEMAAFLDRAMDLPTARRDHFTDDEGSVFEAQINALAEADIAGACDGSGHRFCPGAGVARGEMAAFLRRALDLPATSHDHFTDDAGVFEADINAVAEAGITDGCNPPTNDHFCPGRVVPRGEMATFLARAFDLY